MTDIVFLRKRAPGEPPTTPIPNGLASRPLAIEGVEVPINRYFLNHPEMVLGTWSRKDTLYGGEGYSVTGNGDLAEQLNEAIRRLPEFAPLQASPVRRSLPAAFTPPPPERHITEGSFFVDDDRTICQSVGGQAVPVVYGGTTLKADGTLTGKRLAALVRPARPGPPRPAIAERRLARSATATRPAANSTGPMTASSAAYGPINKTTFGETADGSVIRRMPNLVKFREDPDAMLVMSLEDYDEVTGKAAKAAIMQQGRGRQEPAHHARHAAPRKGCWSPSTSAARSICRSSPTLYGKPEGASHRRTGRPHLPRPGVQGPGRRPTPISPATCGPSSPPPRLPARLMPATPRPCAPCSRRTCCPATSTPISARRGFRRATSRHSPPTSSTSSRPQSRSRHLKKDAVWSIDADYAAKAVGRRHLRVWHGARQRHLAARAGAQHEDARRSTTPSRTATARSASSTRKRRWPPARSKSSSRSDSAPGCSPIPNAPSGSCGSTTTLTTTCVPASSTARTSTSPA